MNRVRKKNCMIKSCSAEKILDNAMLTQVASCQMIKKRSVLHPFSKDHYKNPIGKTFIYDECLNILSPGKEVCCVTQHSNSNQGNKVRKGSQTREICVHVENPGKYNHILELPGEQW